MLLFLVAGYIIIGEAVGFCALSKEQTPCKALAYGVLWLPLGIIALVTFTAKGFVLISNDIQKAVLK